MMEGGDLSPEMFQQMQDRYIERTAGNSHKAYRGLACFIVDDPELGEMIYHTGNNISFKGNAVAIPERRETLVYFMNGYHDYNVNGPMTQLFFGNRVPIPVFQSGRQLP